MEIALIVARTALAGIFLLAAITKLADMAGSRRALEGFNVPARFISAAAVLLPAAELAAAILLVPEATAAVGAALAALLLGLFVAGILAALRRGEAPDCHCFGQIHSRPVGQETLGRNLVLAAAAVFIAVAGGGPGFGEWASDTPGAEVALAATSLLAILASYAALTLWLGQRPRAADGRDLPAPVEPGRRAPDFAVEDLEGTSHQSSDLIGERTVLVFISATCGPCRGLMPELARWRSMLAGRLAIHVLASGDVPTLRDLAEEHDVPLLLDTDGRISERFGVSGTPSGLELSPEGTVMSPPAPGSLAIEGLIRAALKRPADGGLQVISSSGAMPAPLSDGAGGTPS
jgi:peroxiredoxin/uncharacterized membrane protein YphA (DoxX/SURF4 family)